MPTAATRLQEALHHWRAAEDQLVDAAGEFLEATTSGQPTTPWDLWPPDDPPPAAADEEELRQTIERLKTHMLYERTQAPLIIAAILRDEAEAEHRPGGEITRDDSKRERKPGPDARDADAAR